MNRSLSSARIPGMVLTPVRTRLGSSPPISEIAPFDVVKYELDKASGLLKVDRPQDSSSSPPTLYGLIPKTYCGSGVADLSPSVDKADGDPLDI